MPKTEKERKNWAKKIQFYWTVLYTWYRFDYYENATVFGKLLHGIGMLLHVPMVKAYKGYEKLCTRFKGKDTEYVCDTVFIRYLEKNTWKREWFKEAVYMPFENRKIPVPVGYDGRLTAEYGDYMKPAKAPTMHGGLILDPDVPYTEYLKKENK
jgi:lipopolysaccharide cholinephosphotransferase